VFLVENGSVLEFGRDRVRLAGRVTSGQVLVDGLGVGDVGDVVLRDRRQLAQDGIVLVSVAVDPARGEIVAGPEVISRGFVNARESEELIEAAKERVRETLGAFYAEGRGEWPQAKSKVRQALGALFNERTRRRPMIIPVILEVGRAERDAEREQEDSGDGNGPGEGRPSEEE
ncbi:MAG: hypothetical protein K6U08_09115, partial [Firmicutes bacterium]|nr:hypothetical protein [Bacillota bacterium]